MIKPRVRRAFSRAASTYEGHAFLQREICDRTFDHLAPIALKPATIVDLGCGTGYALPRLRKTYSSAHIIAVDLAETMVSAAKQQARRWFSREHFLCADGCQLPLPDASVELVFSNLMLQWAGDLDAMLGDIRRVLRPEGLLAFSSFGPDTLKELRAAWRAVDDFEHVHTFIDMHDVGDALIRAGFASPVLDTETITVEYDQPRQLFRDLKAIGATHAGPGNRGLTTRSALARMERAYEQQRLPNQRIPATWEVVYGHCWVPAKGARPQDGSTVSHVPFSSIGRPPKAG
ncbi:MAG: malonyl-ACP O-methyltransferase BioC [Gammaproteobacteria bacterium]|nr:malonyl-ACP O-methyltransferase BioC [Gammaproteobacteria bacterium]